MDEGPLQTRRGSHESCGVCWCVSWFIEESWVMTVEFFLVFEIDVGVEVERCISTITITMFIDYTIYT